jgi:hypothetical protein
MIVHVSYVPCVTGQAYRHNNVNQWENYEQLMKLVLKKSLVNF